MEWRHHLLAGGCLLALMTVGCSHGEDAVERREVKAREITIGPESSTGPLVVFLGDSLTAGYGLSETEAFPALLSGRLAASGRSARIVNAGISGDTTAGGLARIDWLLSQDPAVVVVELGANDGLRGLSLEETGKNLDAIIRMSLQADARVLLIGMKIPPSYGPEYSSGFEALFGELADRHDIAWMPFLLEGVAAVPDLNQMDGIHPNAAGQRLLAENVLPFLEEILASL